MEELSIRAKALYFDELKKLNELRVSGQKTAALVCRSFPPAILAGLGLRPVRIPFLVSSSDSVNSALTRTDVCPLVLDLLQLIQTDCCDTIIGMHTCDTTRRFFQEAGRFSDIPIHQLQLPATLGEASLKFFVSQVSRISDDLIANDSSLEYNSTLAKGWYINTIRALEFLRERMYTIPPVALMYFFHLFRFVNPSGLIEKITLLLDSVSDYKPAFTILLSGSPVSPGDDVMAEVIEDQGGLLIPVNCTGFQMSPTLTPKDFTQFSIAEKYFNSMKCIRCRPNKRTFTYLQDELEKTAADGLIVKSLSFCDLWYTEKVRLKEQMTKPVLVVDTGLELAECERTTVRIEAFIQTLEIKTNE